MGSRKGKIVEIENPISEDYTCVRKSLLPSLLKICRANKHRSLPQQIFEIGYVVNELARNELRLAAVKIDEKTNFSECKSIVEAIAKDSGLEVKIEKKNHPAFIEGRCASIVVDGNEVGLFGEIHPETITAFELEHPVIAVEMVIENL